MANTYAQFNSMTISGRVSHSELVQRDGQEWLSVTLLSELTKDSEAIAVTFNTTNGLMSMFKDGKLPNGRLVTVTGHLVKFEETYFNKATGKKAMLRRPRLHLKQVQVFEGGFGPLKRDEVTSTPSADIEIDEAPVLAKEAVTSDY